MRGKGPLAGFLFAAPWLIGFGVFLVVPLAKAFYYSFCDYSILNPPVFRGLVNYKNLLQDELFWKSLGNTLYYAVFAIPLATVTAIFLALLLNTKVKEMALYRTVFFLPSLVPAVPVAVLFLWLFNGEQGIVNLILGFVRDLVGSEAPLPNWLGDESLSKPVLVLMAMWAVGNPMVIYLAGLQQIPGQLYEAANIDGATPWQKTWKVTLPLLSPVIQFNVVIAMISALQYFTQAYVMFPSGAPARSTYLYSMYIYDSAFRDNRMGYASAMGWVMFLIILGLTSLALKYSDKHVHYGGA